MNCSTLELVKAREDAYYALKYMKRAIRSYERRENQYNITSKTLDEMRFQKNIIINNYSILCNKIDIITSKQHKINIKKNIPSIYFNFNKSKQLVDKHMQYTLQRDQLELECEVNEDLKRKIKSKISTLKYKLLRLKDSIICHKERYHNGWIKLKKHNEIYEYECIKQLLDKLINNNNNQTHILFELENWKNEFNKISNSVYAIEDPHFEEFETYTCLSTEPSISIYSSESE
jgi:hypothetical protein